MKLFLLCFSFVFAAVSAFGQNEQFVPFRKGEKWGLSDTNKTVILEPRYDVIGFFQRGRARIENAGKIGILDTTTRELVPPLYDEFRDISPNRLWCRTKEGWGIIRCSMPAKTSTSAASVAVVGANNSITIVSTTAAVEILSPRYAEILEYFAFSTQAIVRTTMGNTVLVDTNGIEAPLSSEALEERQTLMRHTTTFPPDGYRILPFRDGLGMVNAELGNLVVRTGCRGIRPFDSNRVAVKRGTHWGVWDYKKSESTVPVMFDDVAPLSDSMIWTKKDGRWFLFNAEKGEEILKPANGYEKIFRFSHREYEVDFADPTERRRTRVLNKKKLGIVDQSGQEIMPTEYDEVRSYYQFDNRDVKGLPSHLYRVNLPDADRADVRSDSAWGVYSLGRQVLFVQAKYRSVSRFAFALAPGGNGRDVIATAVVQDTGKGRKFGLVGYSYHADTAAHEILAPMYDSVGIVCMRRVPVLIQPVNAKGSSVTAKWGIVLLSFTKEQPSREIVKPKYDAIEPFTSNCIAIARVGDQYGLLDTTGREVVPPQYREIQWLAEYLEDNQAEYGFYCVRSAEGKYGLLTSLGKTILQAKYDEIDLVRKANSRVSYIRVRIGQMWGVMARENGKEIIPLRFDDVTPVSDEKFWFVKLNGNVGMWEISERSSITKDSHSESTSNTPVTVRELVPPIYSSLRVPYADFIIASRGDKWGLLFRRNGRECTSIDYEEASYLGTNDDNSPYLAMVRSPKGWRIITSQGKSFIDTLFHDVKPLYKKAFAVRRGDKWDILSGAAQIDVRRYDSLACLYIPHNRNIFGLFAEGGKLGVLDNNFRVIIRPDFSRIEPIFTAFASSYNPTSAFWVCKDDTSCGIVAENTRIIAPLQYHSYSIPDHILRYFRRDWLVVQRCNGQEEYSEQMLRFDGILVKKRNAKTSQTLVGAVSYLTGEEILPVQYDNVGDVELQSVIEARDGSPREKIYYCDLLPSRLSGFQGYLNANTFEEIISPRYTALNRFSVRYALAWLYGQVGILDLRTGTELIPPRFDDINIEGSFAKMRLGDKVSLWKYATATELIPPRYTSIDSVKSGKVRVQLGRNVGLVSIEDETAGKEIIPPDYTNFRLMGDDIAKVAIGDKWGVYALGRRTSSTTVKGSPSKSKTKKSAIPQAASDENAELYNTMQRTSGKEVVEPRYDWIGEFVGGRAKVRTGILWGYIDVTGREIVPVRYDSYITLQTDSTAIAKINGKFGIWDMANNREAVPAQYDRILPLSGNRALVSGFSGSRRQLGMVEYATAQRPSSLILPIQYDEIRPFSEGRAWLRRGTKWCATDTSGTIRIQPQFDEVRDFHNGVAAVRIGAKWGFIGRSGETRLSIQYDEVRSMLGDRAFVRLGKLWGLSDTAGRSIIPPTYTALGDTVNGFMTVQKTDSSRKPLWGVIDTTGRIRVPILYDAIEILDSVVAVRKADKFGIVHTTKGELVVPRYDRISRLNADAFLVHQLFKETTSASITSANVLLKGMTASNANLSNGAPKSIPSGKEKMLTKLGLVRARDGVLLLKPEYDNITPFGRGLIMVENNKRFGFLTADGKTLIPPQFTRIGQPIGERVPIAIGDSLGVYTLSGKQILAPICRDIHFSDETTIHEAMWFQNYDSKWGCVNAVGNILFPPTFTEILETPNGRAWARDSLGWRLVTMRSSGITSQIFPEITAFGETAIFARDPVPTSKQMPAEDVEAITPGRVNSTQASVQIQLPRLGQWRIYDALTGKQLHSSGFDAISVLPQQGYAKVLSGGKWGFIAPNGNILQVPRYDEIGKFSQGRAKVTIVTTTGSATVRSLVSVGYIDEALREIVPVKYDAVRNFIGGRVTVKRMERWGVADYLEGKEIISPSFEWVIYRSGGFADIKLYDKWGIYDYKNNRVALNPSYDAIRTDAHGVTYIKNNGKWGTVDATSGQELIQPQFDALDNFIGGLARVQLDGRFGLINSNGNYVVPAEYAEITMNYHNPNIILLQRIEPSSWKQLYGLCTLSGKMLAQTVYTRIEFEQGRGYGLYANGKLRGYITAQGKEFWE